jgi:hypothetical protein
MTKSIIKIVNVETGEEIEREMTADELAQREADAIEAVAIIAAQSKAAADKAALLEKLGITEDEARLLLG